MSKLIGFVVVYFFMNREKEKIGSLFILKIFLSNLFLKIGIIYF